MNENLNSEGIPFYQLLLIGDAHVGKRNVISRFVKDSFTYGSFVSETDCYIHITDLEDLPIKLHIWDGGRRANMKVNNYPRIPYRASHGIMVLFDTTDIVSFNNVKKWLQDIDRYADEGVNIILVGTKCDLVDTRLVDSSVIKAFAELLDLKYVETSAKTNFHIDEAFYVLTRDIHHRIVGKPTAWQKSARKSVPITHDCQSEPSIPNSSSIDQISPRRNMCALS